MVQVRGRLRQRLIHRFMGEVRMTASLLLLVVITAGLAQAGQEDALVCRWVDESGQIHYTDELIEGCERIAMPEYRAPVRASVPATGREPPLAETPEGSTYKRLEIVSPKEDEALRRLGDLPFQVLVDIDPAPNQRQLLQEAGHRLVVSIDGQQRGFDAELQDGSLALSMTDVFRGTHQLQVTIEDESGKKLIASQVVNFHILQIAPIIRRQQQEQLRKRVEGSTPPPSASDEKG